MGAAESRDSAHDHIVEETNTTPIQNRRVLKLQDPRSPTDAIHRTPIITDASRADFEDPRSPSAMICRTPVSEEADPRSPSEGIPRTPANPFIFPDPRSPSEGITRTPLIKSADDERNFPETEVNATEDSLRKRTIGSGDNQNEKMNNNSNNGKDNSTMHQQVESTNIGQTTIYTPDVEMELSKMSLNESSTTETREESTSIEVQEDSATLVVKDSGLNYRGTAAKKSLKEKFHDPLSQRSSRSPLSTRSLLQNSPSVRDSSPSSPLSGSAKRNGGGVTRPTRLVGRYQVASLDKENV